VDTDPRPDVRLARDLVADGHAYGELGRLVRRGELEHLRRGAYARPLRPPTRARPPLGRPAAGG